MVLTAGAAAQEEACPALQEAALSAILSHCAEQVAGTICYGNPTVSVVYRSGIPDEVSALPFSQPGDLALVDALDWFSVSSEARTWGTVRAVFPAFPEDGLNPETANLVLFGDVALFLPRSAEKPSGLIDIEVVSAQGANLRAEPSTEARVIRPAAQRARLKAVRRSDDGEWLQVYIDPEQLAWVSGSLVTGDVDVLGTELPPQAGAPLWFTMQAFDFRSGAADAPCDAAPDSGLLLQTPKYTSPRRFHINGVLMMLNGTVFLQSQANAGMWIYALDGEARLTAADARTTVSSGAFIHVPLQLDAEGTITAAEAAAPPAAYDYDSMLPLPIHLLLYPTRIGLDSYTILQRRPSSGESPLAGMALDAPCKISTGTFGANIRSRPDPDAPVIAVMGYRESADPIARAIGADDLPWWQLGQRIWIRIDATVTGGNCSAVPLIRYQG